MTPADAPLCILHVLSHDRLRSGGAIQAALLMRAPRRRGHAVPVAFNLGRGAAQARAALQPRVATFQARDPFAPGGEP